MATRRTTEPSRSAKTAPRSKAPLAPVPKVEISADARRGMIAEAAYLRAERRGFASGYELDDWIAAENEVDTLLEAEHTRPAQ
jgi:hypothetical protein